MWMQSQKNNTQALKGNVRFYLGVTEQDPDGDRLTKQKPCF
ncbi:MAG: hypothetical protein N2235_02020 [Fischerella sp.]|nr:hypothetical protein [Fischerella sp.]